MRPGESISIATIGLSFFCLTLTSFAQASSAVSRDEILSCAKVVLGEKDIGKATWTESTKLFRLPIHFRDKLGALIESNGQVFFAPYRFGDDPSTVSLPGKRALQIRSCAVADLDCSSDLNGFLRQTTGAVFPYESEYTLFDARKDDQFIFQRNHTPLQPLSQQDLMELKPVLEWQVRREALILDRLINQSLEGDLRDEKFGLWKPITQLNELIDFPDDIAKTQRKIRAERSQIQKLRAQILNGDRSRKSVEDLEKQIRRLREKEAALVEEKDRVTQMKQELQSTPSQSALISQLRDLLALNRMFFQEKRKTDLDAMATLLSSCSSFMDGDKYEFDQHNDWFNVRLANAFRKGGSEPAREYISDRVVKRFGTFMGTRALKMISAEDPQVSSGK